MDYDPALDSQGDINASYKEHREEYKTQKIDGWVDLLGLPTIYTPGVNDPVFVPYRGGIRQFKFSNSKENEMFFTYHMTHGYKLLSDLFIHAHWSTILADDGNAKWNFEVSYAAGYNRGAFGVPINVSVIQQGSLVPFEHSIAEVQFTDDGVSMINRALLETDGILIVRVFRDSADAEDTLVQEPFVHYVDIHMEVDKVTTPNRNYPFQD